MKDRLQAQLCIRAASLRQMLESGNRNEIEQARDRLRTAMIDGYRCDYFRMRPEKLREYMQLLYRVDRLLSSLGPRLALTKRPDAALHRQSA